MAEYDEKLSPPNIEHGPQDAEKAPSEMARRMRHAGGVARQVVAHAPLSAAVVLGLIFAGVATSALWSPLRDKELFGAVSYGVPAFAEGQWWTPITGMIFGLTPWHVIVMIVLAATVLAVSEWRIGTARTAAVLVVSQLVGIAAATGFAWLFGDALTSNWQWPQHLADARDVGMTTGMLGVATAATATLRSPWRLRSRLILVAYVVLMLLFEGTLSDVMHIFAFAAALYAGERMFREGERGFAPRTRREMRFLAFVGLLAIAATHILVALFPGSGPFGPTDADGESVWNILVSVVLIAVVGHSLRMGKKWAWIVCLVIAVANALVLVLVIVLTATTDFESVDGVTLGTSILWIAEASILVSGRFAFAVPRKPEKNSGDDPETVERVKDLCRTHGGDTMSWMTTWRGNRYAFQGGEAAGSDAVVAYHQHVGTMVALADPICDRARRQEVVSSFIDFAENSGKVPCWFSIGRETADIVRGLGWQATQIAEDTVIDLPGLEFKGKPWQHLRTAMNKAKREEITCRMTRLSDESFAIVSQVRSISEEWVGDKGLPEMGFTLGTTEEAMDPEVRVALALDPEGNVHGVLSWLPVFGGGGEIRGWTLDVMRRRNDGFGPVIEFLIGSSALVFKEEGAEIASLSGSPLTRSDHEADLEQIDKVLDYLGKTIEPYYGFRSLHTFKKKFNPRYEPVFIAYRDESDLARIALAIGRCYLPNATPSQMVRLMASSS